MLEHMSGKTSPWFLRPVGGLVAHTCLDHVLQEGFAFRDVHISRALGPFTESHHLFPLHSALQKYSAPDSPARFSVVPSSSRWPQLLIPEDGGMQRTAINLQNWLQKSISRNPEIRGFESSKRHTYSPRASPLDDSDFTCALWSEPQGQGRACTTANEAGSSSPNEERRSGLWGKSLEWLTLLLRALKL